MCFVKDPNYAPHYSQTCGWAIRYKLVEYQNFGAYHRLKSYCNWLGHPVLEYKVGHTTYCPTENGIYVCPTENECAAFAITYNWGLSEFGKVAILKLQCYDFIAGGVDKMSRVNVETWGRVLVLAAERKLFGI